MAVDLTKRRFYERTTAQGGGSVPPFTTMMWIRPDAVTDGDVFWYQGNDSFALFQLLGFVSGGRLQAATVNGDTGTSGPVVSTGTWLFVGLSLDASHNYALYWRLENAGSLTKATGTLTSSSYGANRLMYGASQASGTEYDGRMAFARFFNSVLSEANVLAESAHASGAGSPWGSWPMAAVATVTNDVSGNSRTLTSGGAGAVADATDPTIALPGGAVDLGTVAVTAAADAASQMAVAVTLVPGGAAAAADVTSPLSADRPLTPDPITAAADVAAPLSADRPLTPDPITGAADHTAGPLDLAVALAPASIPTAATLTSGPLSTATDIDLATGSINLAAALAAIPLTIQGPGPPPPPLTLRGPMLAPARATAETLFDATCTITVDPEGPADDIRDETTITTSPPPNDTITLYTGPCLLRPPSTSSSSENTRTRQAAAQVYNEDLRARIPATITAVRPGAVLTVDSSPTDPSLEGRSFDVIRVITGSYAVTRMLLLADQARGPRV